MGIIQVRCLCDSSSSNICDSLRSINRIINAKIPHVEGVRKLLLLPRQAVRER